jgi:hypothetical protein
VAEVLQGLRSLETTVYTHIHIHINTHTYIHTHTHTYIHTHTHTHTHLHIHTYIYTHTYTQVPGVEDILKELASIIKQPHIKLFPHNIASSISGLRSMSSENNAAVREVFRALITKATKTSLPLSLREAGHVLYGMQVYMCLSTLEVLFCQ